MKKAFVLITLLTSLSLSGCDALDKFFDDVPSQKEEDKKDKETTLKSISLEGDLQKTNYEVGQDWDDEGLSVKGKFSDNTESILDSSKYTLLFDPEKPELDSTSVTVSAFTTDGLHSNNLTINNIVVTDPEEVKSISRIVLEGDLQQTDYQDNQPWSSSGLSVRAYYENSQETTILDNSQYTLVYSPERATYGTSLVSIKALLNNSDIESEARVFNVYITNEDVNNPYITSITLLGNLATTSYEVDDEWDYSGFSVEAKWSNDDTTTLSSYQYDLIATPAKAAKNTTSVSIYARLKDSQLTSESRSFPVTVKDSTPTVYTVSFNANGGSGTMTSVQISGDTYVVPACEFSKSGYSFNKWALNSASGTQYDVGDTIYNIASNIVLYATWTKDSEEPDPYNGYYNGIDDTASNLLSQLRSLNSKKRTSTVGYKNMLNNPEKGFYVTDPGNGANTITTFYSGKNNNGTSGLNREHVWPDSRGGNYVEADIHMPRPTLTKENGSRGNSFYVEGKCSPYGGWDPAKEDFGLESYRGDSARIIFYCVIASNQLSLVDKENDSTDAHTMGKLSDLLKWNLEYEVLEREQVRNNGAQSLQGNRNPFIDHPEYACKIWGNTNDATKKVCGIN